MEPIFNALFKIDISSDEVSLQQFQDNDNLNSYILELLTNVASETGDREFEFAEESLTMRTLLENIIADNERDSACETIAKRLLAKEIDAQKIIERLKKEIHKGMLIISFVKMTETEKKIIISKADYNEFIEEVSGNKKSGLPIKKKIFKAFIANVSLQNGTEIITNLFTYDSNAVIASYWWKEFLELKTIRNDDENTKIAFSAIEKAVLIPIKEKYKQDYLLLWNATIAYFRGEGEFDLIHYRDVVIGDYIPFDKDLKIKDIKKRITELPTKAGFDIKFKKNPSLITNRFKNVLSLTTEINLVLMHDIANPKKTFKKHEDADGKYLMIRSDKGYEFAYEIERQKTPLNE